ncbi:hypothetical protein [Geomonas oryzae]|uniref:hypothetical protein n=1 Tax=Geomonas oryzae TaxID=2364273 RepID=UPI00100AFB31|nr:hypothetical protein [Geomonas oryzae]
MLNLSRRPLGKLLVDGKLLSPHNLESALTNLKRTKELLGQTLVRMGVLTSPEVDITLHLQGHLNHIEDAVKVAAGERRLLGALLVESGQIGSGQLDQAIAEQKRSGERLGEVFIRLGLLTRRQLTALLDFQQSQDATAESPLRLGELLVATGYISREQLEHACEGLAMTTTINGLSSWGRVKILCVCYLQQYY